MRLTLKKHRNKQTEEVDSCEIRSSECLKILSEIRYKGLSEEQRKSIENFFKDGDREKQISNRVIEIAIEDCEKYSNGENVVQLISIGAFFVAVMGLFLPSQNLVISITLVVGFVVLLCAVLRLLHQARSSHGIRKNVEQMRSFLVMELNKRYLIKERDI